MTKPEQKVFTQNQRMTTFLAFYACPRCHFPQFLWEPPVRPCLRCVSSRGVLVGFLWSQVCGLSYSLWRDPWFTLGFLALMMYPYRLLWRLWPRPNTASPPAWEGCPWRPPPDNWNCEQFPEWCAS